MHAGLISETYLILSLLLKKLYTSSCLKEMTSSKTRSRVLALKALIQSTQLFQIHVLRMLSKINTAKIEARVAE